MWISKERWENLQRKDSSLEKEIKLLKENINQSFLIMAERILKQPDELLAEIEDIKRIEALVDDLINEPCHDQRKYCPQQNRISNLENDYKDLLLILGKHLDDEQKETKELKAILLRIIGGVENGQV